MTILHRNMHEGTRLIRNVLDTTRDRAVAIYQISAVDSASSLNNSILEAVADQDTFPGTSLPLASVETRFLTHTKHIAILRYARTPMSLPTRPSFESARLSTGMIGIRWYKSPSSFTSGQPSGAFDSPDLASEQNGRPRPWTWQVPVTSISAFTVLDTDPTSSLADEVGKTNTSAVTFRNNSFGANTVRFDSVVSREFDNDGDLTYAVTYLFTARRDGWTAPVLDYDTTTAGQWDQTVPDIYERSWVAGTFPVHA